MRIPVVKEHWPIVWKESQLYDQLEWGNNHTNPGYTYAYKQRFHAIVDMVQQYLPIGSTVLDIAAAQGNFSLHLAEKGYQVIWNDLREELQGYVALKHEKGSITYKPGNAFELEGLQPVDAVIITEIIEHVAHPDQFLIEVKALVKPGGYIFMSTPLGNYFLNKLPRFSECADPSIYESIQFKPNSDGHIFLLYEDEIQQLAKDTGITIREQRIYNNPLTSGHIGMHHLLKWIPSQWVQKVERFSQRLPRRWKNKLHSNIAVAFQVEYGA